MGLAHEGANGARAPVRSVLSFTERKQRVHRPAIAHLVVQPHERDVVSRTERTVVVHEQLWDQKERYALGSRRAAGDFGEHEMDDVFGQVVLAARDPHLISVNAVSAGHGLVGLGAGRDVADGRACLLLREAHRSEIAPLEHRADEPGLLLGRSVGEEQIGRSYRKERVGRGTNVGSEEEAEPRLFHDHGKTHAAVPFGLASGDEPSLAEGVECHLHFFRKVDTRSVEGRLFFVALLRVRRKKLARNTLARAERGLERFTRMGRKLRPRRQGFCVEPFVEEERHVPSRENVHRPEGKAPNASESSRFGLPGSSVR